MIYSEIYAFCSHTTRVKTAALIFLAQAMATKTELSFEEFRALRRRRARDEEDKNEDVSKSVLREEDTAVPDDNDTLAMRAGRLVEMEEVQMLSSSLIVTDAIGSIIQTLGYADQGFLRRLLDAFFGFTAFALLFELIALVIAFGSAFWFHPGYLLDSLVIGICLRIEMTGTTSALRLIGIARIWRLYRLHEAIIARVRNETNQISTLLETERMKCLRLELELATAQTSVRQANDAKLRLEHMCKAYKDEIDTLNEALAIAAMDVAEAGDDELNEEDDAFPSTIDSTIEKQTATFVVDSSGSYHRAAAVEDELLIKKKKRRNFKTTV
uniref:Hydrogen voltage-gated channel 1 n=1 Tax=Aureoumbra lagunensis TaxID=44058 RepID=A0A7S3JQG0_9STRA